MESNPCGIAASRILLSVLHANDGFDGARLCGYIDDIIVHGQDDSVLLVNLRQGFERCRQYRIAFNPRKSKIGLDRIDWVGHQLDADGIHFSAEQLSEVVPDACRGKGSV